MWMVVMTLALIWLAWNADVKDIKMGIMMIRQYFTLQKKNDVLYDEKTTTDRMGRKIMIHQRIVMPHHSSASISEFRLQETKAKYKVHKASLIYQKKYTEQI